MRRVIIFNCDREGHVSKGNGMSAMKQAFIGWTGFATGGLDTIGPELLSRLPYPYHPWRQVLRRRQEQTQTDCQPKEVAEVKKIHDPKDETDVLGVGRGRRPTQYLKCSHPCFSREFRG